MLRRSPAVALALWTSDDTSVNKGDQFYSRITSALLAAEGDDEAQQLLDSSYTFFYYFYLALSRLPRRAAAKCFRGVAQSHDKSRTRWGMFCVGELSLLHRRRNRGLSGSSAKTVKAGPHENVVSCTVSAAAQG